MRVISVALCIMSAKEKQRVGGSNVLEIIFLPWRGRKIGINGKSAMNLPLPKKLHDLKVIIRPFGAKKLNMENDPRWPPPAF